MSGDAPPPRSPGHVLLWVRVELGTASQIDRAAEGYTVALPEGQARAAFDDCRAILARALAAHVGVRLVDEPDG